MIQLVGSDSALDGATGARVVPVRFGWHRGRTASDRFEKPDLSGISSEPLVSCLCVTENRQAFMPWLLWNYDRQTWKNRELVIVDSSEPAIELPARDDIRVIRAPLGTWLGQKRNLALDAARGEVIAWFDDDDWQHARRLELLVPLLRACAETLGASFVGPSRSWFVDVHTGRCQRYEMKDYAIFNGSVFYRAMVRHARFPEGVLRNEDTSWLSTLLATRQGAALSADYPTLFFWLSHDANITNRREAHRLHREQAALLRSLADGWGDTSNQLAELRARLELQPARRPARAEWAERARVQERADARAHAPLVPWRASAPIPAEAAPTPASLRGTERSAAVSAGPTGIGSPPVPHRTTAKAGMRLLIYAIADQAPVAPVDARFVVCHLPAARYAQADVLAALTVRDRPLWLTADLVGFLDHRFVRDSGLSWDLLAQAVDSGAGRHEVYAYGSRGRLLEPSGSGNGAAGVLGGLLERMGQKPALLDREMPVLKSGFVARPRVLIRYVNEWLIPARALLRERTSPSVGGTPQQSQAAEIAALSALPSVFFAAERYSVRLLP